MGTKKVILRHRRLFTEEFKKARVKEYEQGAYTVKELGKLFSINEQVIYSWIYKYSTYNQKNVRIVEMEKSSYKKVKELHERIKELERIIGQKQLNIDYLEKMIELAKEHYGIDLKKNFNTPHSSGSGSTEKKQE
jgi:transposase-like protein